MQGGILCNSLVSVDYGSLDVPLPLVPNVMNEIRTCQQTFDLNFTISLAFFTLTSMAKVNSSMTEEEEANVAHNFEL